ncbi:MFS multidrug transporter [Penicillium angulare]|uniref:MFS multidrug transporter n=1 Tax=Penicillium angulare TaxID=116970 RepID=A0A9W9EGE1_9EURO|nr:MFS multidrug transporter [Penicillium angulare]
MEQNQYKSHSSENEHPNQTDLTIGTEYEKQDRPSPQVRGNIADERDVGFVEKNPDVPETSEATADSREDSKLVTWNGPDDPENPKNWHREKKGG